MRSSGLVALAASLSTATAAVYQGFNYGSTQSDGSIKAQADFEAEFKTAKGLAGTDGAFTSARIYTTIQGGTTADPIAAIPAAIAQDTTLLLGVWASSGEETIDNEITALKAAISTYGTKFTSLVAGLSVGSEDLYRISPTGIAAKSNPGADPATLVSYIKKVRSALAGTALSDVPIGHVDTWTAWVNGSNADVISNADWIGVDAYPYFQNTMSNGIDSGEQLFFDAYDATVAVSGGKPVWITETGWPVSGSTENLAVPSTANAKTYWDEVGCARSFGKINTFWFTLQDAAPVVPNPSFGVVGSTLSTTPLYDLSCKGVSSASSSSKASTSTKASSESASASSAAASATSGALTPSQGAGNGAGAGGAKASSVDSSVSITASASGSETTSASETASATETAVVSTTTTAAPGTTSSGTAASSGIVTSTVVAGNGTAPTAGAPSGTTTSSTSVGTNAAAAFSSGSFLGGALGAVFVVAALL